MVVRGLAATCQGWYQAMCYSEPANQLVLENVLEAQQLEPSEILQSLRIDLLNIYTKTVLLWDQQFASCNKPMHDAIFSGFLIKQDSLQLLKEITYHWQPCWCKSWIILKRVADRKLDSSPSLHKMKRSCEITGLYLGKITICDEKLYLYESYAWRTH